MEGMFADELPFELLFPLMVLLLVPFVAWVSKEDPFIVIPFVDVPLLVPFIVPLGLVDDPLSIFEVLDDTKEEGEEDEFIDLTGHLRWWYTMQLVNLCFLNRRSRRRKE